MVFFGQMSVAQKKHMNGTTHMAQEFWGEIKETIKHTVGVNNFNTWIAPLNFCEIENGVAVFEVPTNFIGNYVAQNFSDVILFQLSALFGDVRRLRFDVVTGAPSYQPKIKQQALQKVSPRLKHQMNFLVRHSTLDLNLTHLSLENQTSLHMQQHAALAKGLYLYM